jgi:hypothetical protein
MFVLRRRRRRVHTPFTLLRWNFVSGACVLSRSRRLSQSARRESVGNAGGCGAHDRCEPGSIEREQTSAISQRVRRASRRGRRGGAGSCGTTRRRLGTGGRIRPARSAAGSGMPRSSLALGHLGLTARAASASVATDRSCDLLCNFKCYPGMVPRSVSGVSHGPHDVDELCELGRVVIVARRSQRPVPTDRAAVPGRCRNRR